MFENTLVALRRRREITRKLKVLPVALGIHAVALGFVVVTQLWAVSEVPEPYTVVSFYSAPPPPPPAGRAAGKGATPIRTARATLRPPDVAPISPPTESAKPAEPGDTGDTGAVEGGDPEGDPNGMPGGAEPPVGTEMRAAAEADAPRTLSPEMKRPLAVYRPAPVYPELARAARRQGAVIVEAVIDRQGNVVDARVLRDLGFGLGEAALLAVRTWRYQPATLDGRPVTVYLTVTVNFELHGAG
jgi:protein TonB